MKSVRYSIIITSYNQREFIREAVNSALLQSGEDTEVIVVDDASSDGSCEILGEYGDRIKFAVLPANGGAPRARNYGASMATGEYLLFLDGDDVLMPWALDVYKRIIERRKPMLILGQMSQFAGPVPSWKLREIAHDLLKFVEYSCPMDKDRAAVLSSSATVVERAAFVSVGGWTPDIFYGDNKDFLMKLGYSGSLILILEPMTVFYRVHQRNSIHNIASFLNSAHRLIAKERTGQYPGGRAQAFKRSAALGVFVAYWAMKGLAAGLWKQVLELAVNGFPMVVAGAFQRFVIRIKGRSHAETIGTAGLHFQAQQPSLSAKRSNS